jgi:hypothetical protein
MTDIFLRISLLSRKNALNIRIQEIISCRNAKGGAIVLHNENLPLFSFRLLASTFFARAGTHGGRCVEGAWYFPE